MSDKKNTNPQGPTFAIWKHYGLKEVEAKTFDKLNEYKVLTVINNHVFSLPILGCYMRQPNHLKIFTVSW